ncbi:MAG: DUF4159 domain-containing protein [Alphaproteobacteria bacterium]|nr:DUF4159 domain-containing protein [Alphaproteobacteria bacterium]
MSALLGNFALLNPWILSGLLALPALWFLLRVMPPAPRLIKFPAIRFLKDLIADEQTPSHTPWWILLLRLSIAALVILALSHPVHNPAQSLGDSGPLKLIIDNDWPSAQNWDAQKRAAEDLIQRARRENRNIYILTTALQPGQAQPLMSDPLAGAAASSFLDTLKPQPWAADYEEAAKLLSENQPPEGPAYWLGSGAQSDNSAALSHALDAYTYLTPPSDHAPLTIKDVQINGAEISLNIQSPAAAQNGRAITIHALSADGQVLDYRTLPLNTDTPITSAQLDLPPTLSAEVSQLRIASTNGAGAVYILDNNTRKRSVSIVGPGEESDIKPFMEDIYYLKRALEPYSTLHIGDIDSALEQNPAVIILPDIAAMPAQTLNALEDWVKAGGLLLRFAGPNMTQGSGSSFLTPLPLSTNMRSNDGALSWDNPPTLTPFSKDSPLYGITLRDDIKVRQQILPESTSESAGKIWASLDDGTPLITGAPLGQGLLVMTHTTASAQWSDLALSGTYVEILQRIMAMAGRSAAALDINDGTFNPLWVMDGFGHAQKPQSWIKPIQATEFSATTPGPLNPPGLYELGSFTKALNIGDHITSLSAHALPGNAKSEIYGQSSERDLMPALLMTATLLLLLDWAIMIIIASGGRRFARIAAALALITITTTPAHAADEIDYANGFYLAFIKTGDQAIDTASQIGLENLAKALRQRTSVEPDGVAALDPQDSSLPLFPFIYWPISPNQPAPDAQGLQNIQNYLDHGGTILFDTRDGNAPRSSYLGTQNTDALRRITQFLNIPPLQPIGKDHVLGRAFYLLDEFPGRYRGDTLWVEGNSRNGRDGVSSVIVGSHDWAGAWAIDRSSRYTLSGGPRQQELATRFGINMVIYALTGNYKADQVHVPHILERLGQ